MSAKPLSSLASELAHVSEADRALAIIQQEVSASDSGAGFALLTFDGRQSVLLNRALVAERPESRSELAAEPPHLALDHLPPVVRHALLSGGRFAEVGDQSSQYAHLLGVELATSELRLFLRGIVVEGALVAALALYDSRRRGSSKLVERAEPLAGLFELAFLRLYERDARFEAVTALHDVTSRLRAEHASALGALEREVERLRAAQEAGTSDVVRQLREAVTASERRAATAEQRLGAVETQVVSAVERLERLHIQLAEQDATIRSYRETISSLHQQIGDGSATAITS